MHRNAKVATCCYCGTRAALVLGPDHHVLTCATCGAPIRDLKNLPVAAVPAGGHSVRPYGVTAPPGFRYEKPKKTKARKTKAKTRKKAFKRFAGKFLDEIGDLFD